MIIRAPMSALNRRSCLIVLAGCAALAIPACEPSLPDYRYRLTVEVDTPDGVRTGSSVIQVASHVSSQYSLAPGDVTTQVTGEAVAVDLPGGRTLFALLSKPGSAEGANSYALDALVPKPWVGSDEYIAEVNALARRRDVGVLPAEDWPMLVTFEDTNVPTSVRSIDPFNLGDEFGSGIKIRRITVRVTQAPLTKGLRSRLPWLGKHPEPALGGTPDLYDFSVPATLRHGDFAKNTG